MMSSDNDAAEHEFESAISAALSLETLSEVESAEREIRAMSASQLDEMYSQLRTTDRNVSELIRTGRFALHSWRLSCVQPVTGERLEFTAPLPARMAALSPKVDNFVPNLKS